jgi:predicted PurR-regulated permease PerM
VTTPTLGALIGLALGAIWAVAGFGYAFLAGLLTGIGYLVGLVLERNVDIRDYLRQR